MTFVLTQNAEWAAALDAVLFDDFAGCDFEEMKTLGVDGQLDIVAPPDPAAWLQAGDADGPIVQRHEILVEILRGARVFGIDCGRIDGEVHDERRQANNGRESTKDWLGGWRTRSDRPVRGGAR